MSKLRKRNPFNIKLIAEGVLKTGTVKKSPKSLRPYKAPVKNNDVCRWVLLFNSGREEMIFIRSIKTTKSKK